MGLSQISRAAKRTSPVFIIGEARSGSSMLYRVLLRHPSFAPRAETLQETSFVRQAPLAYRFDAGHPSNMRRYMLEDDDAWRAFLDSLAPVRPLLAAAAVTQPLLGRFGWAWYLAPSRRVARSYLHHAQLARACRRILEKTPRHVEHMGRLFACFPRARLLYIHRHPVDVYSSYVRRGQTDPRAAWARIPWRSSAPSTGATPAWRPAPPPPARRRCGCCRTRPSPPTRRGSWPRCARSWASRSTRPCWTASTSSRPRSPTGRGRRCCTAGSSPPPRTGAST